MKIEFEINDVVYAKAGRYTLDPADHCKTMLEHWAQMAEQNHPGVDLLTLPSLTEQEQKRKNDEAQAALAYEQRKQAIEAVIARAKPELQDALRQKLNAMPNATRDDADAAVRQSVESEQERIAQEQIRTAQEAQKAAEQEAAMEERILALLVRNPALLAAAAAAQGKTVANAT